MSARKVLWIVLGLTILLWGGVLVYLLWPAKKPISRVGPSILISPTPSRSRKNVSSAAQKLTEITFQTPQGDSWEITAGKNCTELFIKIAYLQKNIVEGTKSASLIYDINKDGKIDYLDLTKVTDKITAGNSEDWCDQILRKK
ncbi:hypothetical protein FJZ40_04255 [Candidatus Shapirobacteria bacterium]|nr:hypothetical protein [Candidatus Shapirobacteria bacterium]